MTKTLAFICISIIIISIIIKFWLFAKYLINWLNFDENKILIKWLISLNWCLILFNRCEENKDFFSVFEVFLIS